MPMAEKLLLLALPLFFITLWCCICLLASWLGGWRRLAEHYATDRDFTGTRRARFCTVTLRPRTNYGRCVTIGVEEDGLWFSVLPIFRLGHPPLVIPWSDLKATPKKRWLIDTVELQFAACPKVVMIIRRGTFERAIGVLEPGGRLSPTR